MEPHQLRYFCAVARTGSFTRAAEEEGVSQPTLSQQVHKLESDLGLALFERLGRAIRLTPAGERLLPQARALLRQLADARQSIQDLREGVRGRLVVGSIPTIMPYLLAPRVAQFQSLYPDVELHLVEDLTSRLVESLQAGDIDLAVLSLPLSHPELICSELAREALLVAVPPRHALSGARSLEVRDVRMEPLLILREGHCFRDQALRACRRARLEPGAVFESDQFASIFALVAAGFGISVVPEMAALEADGCSLVPLKGGATRRVGYVQARRRYVPPAQKAFIAWLRDSTRPRPEKRRTNRLTAPPPPA